MGAAQDPATSRTRSSGEFTPFAASLVAIRKEFPDARVVVLTTFEGHAHMRRALKGAAGYFLKSTSPLELAQGIRQVHAGRKTVPPEVAARLVDLLHENPLMPRSESASPWPKRP